MKMDIRKMEVTKKINGKKLTVQVHLAEIAADEYSWLKEVEKIILNDIEIKGENGEVSWVYDGRSRKYVLALELKGEGAKIFKEKFGIKTKKSNIFITMQEYETAWEKVEELGREMQEEKRILKEKTEELKANELFQDETKMKLHYRTGSGFSSPEYEKSTRGKETFKKIKIIKSKEIERAIERYKTEIDVGDYTITTYYELPVGRFETKINRLYEIAQEKKAIEEAEKEKQRIQKEKRKEKIKMEVIKQGNDDGDSYARVELTDNETGEKKRFDCRNLFDCGFVINPLYPLAKGLEPGGIRSGEHWKTFVSGKGWIVVRDLTEVEKRMMDWLEEFSPIGKEIRM